MKKQIVRFLIFLVACLLAFSVFKFRKGRSFSSNRVPAETPAPVQTATEMPPPQSSPVALPQPQSARTAAAAPPPAPEPTPADLASVPRIPTSLLAQKLGTVTVIDVRDADSYIAGHVAGARHIPLNYLPGEVPYLPKDKPIVTYCT